MFENLKKWLASIAYEKYANSRPNYWPRNRQELYKTTDLVDSIYKFLAYSISNFEIYGLPDDMKEKRYSVNELLTTREFFHSVVIKLLQEGTVAYSFEDGIILEEYEITTKDNKTYYLTEIGLYSPQEIQVINYDRFWLEDVSKILLTKLLELDKELLEKPFAKYLYNLETQLSEEDLQDLKKSTLVADENGIIISEGTGKLEVLNQVNLAEKDAIARIESKVYKYFSMNDELLHNNASPDALDQFNANVIEPVIALIEQNLQSTVSNAIKLIPSYNTRTTPTKQDMLAKQGSVTINELRISAGYDPIDKGDILIENWNASKNKKEE